MSPSTVSVCINNYNYGPFVGASVRSALSQTYPHVEVIVVDDGSTDGSLAELEAFGSRIRLIARSNGGQFTACRQGVEESTGDIVILLDSDDLLDAGVVQRVVDAFDAQPDAGRVQWRMRVIDADGAPTGALVPPVRWEMPDGDLSGHVARRRTYVWPPTSGNAFRRPVASEILAAVGDERVWVDLVLAEASPFYGPIVNLQDPGGSYRYHGDNWSANVQKDWIRYLHERIETIVEGHRRLIRLLGARSGLVSPNPLAALDWALIGYRLASLRMDPALHPLPFDRRWRLAARGIYAVATQPRYSWTARLKRVAWFAALAGVPRGYVEPLIEKAYSRPFGDVSAAVSSPT